MDIKLINALDKAIQEADSALYPPKIGYYSKLVEVLKEDGYEIIESNIVPDYVIKTKEIIRQDIKTPEHIDTFQIKKYKSGYWLQGMEEGVLNQWNVFVSQDPVEIKCVTRGVVRVESY